MHKIRHSIHNVLERILFPFAGLMILYCLVRPLIITFEYIRVIQYFLLVIAVVFFILNIFSKDANKGLYKENKMWTILKWIFIGYFAVYMVLGLDMMSVYFNYLAVLLYGMVVGYRLRKS